MFVVSACAQTEAGGYRLVINYDRPGLVVPRWQITIPPQGMAEYTGKPEKGIDPGQVLFPFSESGRARLGAWMNRTKGLQPCETKAKNLANMGSKDISYLPNGGAEAHCSFNYTDNKPLSEAADYLLALAATLQTGIELDRLHRYDRLGLDPAMIRLGEEVKAGRAVELGAIRPTLESLVTDEALLDRVRAKAQQLLDLAKQQESAAGSR